MVRIEYNDMPSDSAIGVGATYMLLWCAAIRDDRLKTAARARDFNDSCSHKKSLNCFG
jgi:hypothetical protein